MNLTSISRRVARISALFVVATFAATLSLARLNAGSPSYRWTHLAGSLTGPGSADGTGSAARFAAPGASAVDASGDVYIADTDNHTIRKITSGGVATTLAGTAGISGSADGTGSAARFNSPLGIAVDGTGNVFVADYGNSTIRKITPGGVVTTFAGTAASSGSADGTGSTARFHHPQGLAIDGSGNVFVADYGNSTIRKVTPGGVVTTFAGTAGSSGSTDGTGSAARFNYPQGLAVDGSGNFFVADTNNQIIRKVTPGGVVTTFAGTAGSSGSVDGTGSAARFSYPQSLAVDSAGNVFVADVNHTMRKITSSGEVTTLAGTVGSSGSDDGTGSAARFNYPKGVAVDGAGNVFVADTINHTIRKITSSGVVTTFAGAAPTYGSVDGSGSLARFSFPQSLAVDGSGNVFVADRFNHAIRKITPDGDVTTFAGAAGNQGSADGTGGAARFSQPSGITIDGSGNLFVADTSNHTVRKITPSGLVTTLAGSAGSSGSVDGTGSTARFNSPFGIAVDDSGNVFVADLANHTIRKITPGGVVTTLAGTIGSSGSADGSGSAARFNSPQSLAADGAGNIFVADTDNHTIRKITSGGIVTTFAGTAGSQGSADSTGSAARFYRPTGIAVDGDGNIFVSDQYNNAIRKITPGGVVTTVGGIAGNYGSSDGTGPAAHFYSPNGIAVGTNGNLYVADSSNNCIRKGQRLGTANAFNASGTTDLLWQNTTTGDRGLWRMAGTAFSSWFSLGNISTDWRIAANADFNGDGSTDIVWENTATGDRYFWFLTNGAFSAGSPFVNAPTVWRIAAAADFNSDSYPDILWENTSTGDHVVWFMNGTTYSNSAYVGNVSNQWRVAAVADFNGDSQPDLLWENTSTGNRGLWLMSGAAYSSWVDLGVISTAWRIAGSGDFNDDGSSDIIWENTSTGDRVAWLMNGTAYASSAYLGNVDTSWSIRN